MLFVAPRRWVANGDCSALVVRAQDLGGWSSVANERIAHFSRRFNVTRERIRQIEIQSLRRLQDLGGAHQLRGDGEIAPGSPLRTVRH
jgi:hypothetical protein